METVYLETTIISYLVSDPSRDIIVAAHQQATKEWWKVRRKEFECRVSQVVIEEAMAGDPEQSRKRMTLLKDLPVLEVTHEAQRLTDAILAAGVIPRRAVRDAAHISVATVGRMDYLLTWNCSHLANAQIIRKVAAVCTSRGTICPSYAHRRN